MNPKPQGAGSLAERMIADACVFVDAGWCRGAEARDECGRPIEPSSAFARSWSFLGALERAWRRSPESPEAAQEAFERARLALALVVKEHPAAWNDRPERSAADVSAALTAALEAMRAGEFENLDHVGPRYALEEGEPGISVPSEAPREP